MISRQIAISAEPVLYHSLITTLYYCCRYFHNEKGSVILLPLCTVYCVIIVCVVDLTLEPTIVEDGFQGDLVSIKLMCRYHLCTCTRMCVHAHSSVPACIQIGWVGSSWLICVRIEFLWIPLKHQKF